MPAQPRVNSAPTVYMMVLLLNALLVALGTAGFYPSVLAERSFYAVMLISTFFCMSDLTRLRLSKCVDQLPASETDRWLCQLTGLAIFSTWWTAIVFAQTPSTTWLALGVALAILGATVRQRAVSELGGDFVSDVAPVSHHARMRTSGIYSIVRHPSELGLLLMTLSAGVAAASTCSIAAWLGCVVPLSVYRVYREEKELLSEFGDDYQTYRRQAGAFLPRY